MSIAWIAYLAGMGVGAAFTAAHGQGLQAVAPIPGYACMSLNQNDADLRSGRAPVPVHSAPDGSSVLIGIAPGTVLATSPLNVVNGFAQVLTLGGKVGWIGVNMLVAYHSETDPNAHCTASWMSNGKPGYGP